MVTNVKWLPALALATLSAGAITARADTVNYYYTGLSMSGTESGDIGPDLDFETIPVVLSITGVMTLSDALAPNLTNAIVDPIAMTFSIDDLSGPIGGPVSPVDAGEFTSNPMGSPVLLLEAPLSLSTDSQGAISAWDLSLTGVTFEYIRWGATSVNNVSGAGDTVTGQGGTHGPYFGGSNTAAGSWSTPSPVPLPSSVWLLLSALGGMGLLVRRRGVWGQTFALGAQSGAIVVAN